MGWDRLAMFWQIFMLVGVRQGETEPRFGRYLGD